MEKELSHMSGELDLCGTTVTKKDRTPQLNYYYAHKAEIANQHREYLKRKNNSSFWVTTRKGITTITIKWETPLVLNEQIKERAYWLRNLKEYNPIIDISEDRATIMYIKTDKETQKKIEESLQSLPIYKHTGEETV